MRVKLCPTMLKPQELEILGSRGKTYNVITPTFFTNGLCDCPDYEYRAKNKGECKHIRRAFQENVCQRLPGPDDTRCPDCGQEVWEVVIPDGN